MKRLAIALILTGTLAWSQDDPFEDDWDDDWGADDGGINWGGWLEGAFGRRLGSDAALNEQKTLSEVRGRVEAEWRPERATFGFRGDLWYDDVIDQLRGEIRDLSISLPIGNRFDVRLGQQVLTWGTGDLLFLNDLFPKDFVSFFAGRDDEYLKAPGAAIRLSHYGEPANIDVVWSPVFDPDVYLDGRRFSFFFPPAGENVAPRPPLSAIRPERQLDKGEFALRVFKTVNGREYAAYAYRGYFKQPLALTPNLTARFARMASLGASLRQPLGAGLANAEVAWYSSREDRSGRDPLIPNSQLRILAGYEWEAHTNLTIGLQYYLEVTLAYDELRANSPFPDLEPEEFRHLLTNRLTYRAGRGRHTLSLFTFYSPSDDDFYLRPTYSYRHSDRWSIAAGGNLFGGGLTDDAMPQTFFNQLEDASNLYLRLRYSY